MKFKEFTSYIEELVGKELNYYRLKESEGSLTLGTVESVSLEDEGKAIRCRLLGTNSILIKADSILEVRKSYRRITFISSDTKRILFKFI